MERDREDSLDLGHLTEHEQEAILQVLLRDSELRRRDEGRVRSLQETEVNPVRLRTLSGSWFSEERSKRHRSAKPGADLVHSSIRRRKSKGRELPLADLFDGLGKEPPPGALCSLTPGIGGSMMSLFSSGEFGSVEVRGRLQFSLVYHTQREELLVSVCRCEDLATARKNRSDPYVKAYLLPDKSSHSKKKTKVKKNTQSPVYDQTLKYKVPVGELRGRTLNLSVWHAEALGRNIFLGEVEVLLASWDWACSQPQWHPLQPRVQLSPDDISSRGIIVFSVKFIPQGSEGGGLPLTGELHIWLREAQGLLSIKGGAVDSFVKSYILPDAGRQSGQKTRTVKHSISPAYNHTMVYDGFHTSDLREACAELTVWQRDGLKTRPLGGVRLSPGTGQSYGEDVVWMDSTKEERAVWDAMMENPHKWIDASLPIRTNILLQNN
uniref:Synaptotagmin-like protein 1 n=1 Tax=Gadus morhua TaxID=8049 RepID=A0A8C5AVZ5_GADMO